MLKKQNKNKHKKQQQQANKKTLKIRTCWYRGLSSNLSIPDLKTVFKRRGLDKNSYTPEDIQTHCWEQATDKADTNRMLSIKNRTNSLARCDFIVEQGAATFHNS